MLFAMDQSSLSREKFKDVKPQRKGDKNEGGAWVADVARMASCAQIEHEPGMESWGGPTTMACKKWPPAKLA